MSEFHDRLRQAMDVAGLRPGQLAERSTLDKHQISHALAGKKPTLETLAKLLNALPHVDARWLVTGKNK